MPDAFVVIISQEISLEDLQDQPELFDSPPGPAPEQLDLFNTEEPNQQEVRHEKR